MTKFLTVLAAATVLTAGPAAAQTSPGVTVQKAGVQSFLVGTVRVTALSDGTVPIDLHQLLRGIPKDRIDTLLKRAFSRNPMEASINAYLIELGDRRVLVDAGAGELFGPGNGGRLPQALAAFGLRPSDITDILITHVHSDHSGGLVVDGRALFPNATVHVGKPDVDFFLDPANAARTGYDQRYFDEAARTLGPYVSAKRVKTFDRPGEILPGILAELHPGHTPGTAFYTLISGNESIVFIGDIIHAAAVQFPEPKVTITFDHDQPRARDIRLKAFDRFTANESLLAAPHLSFPGVGRIKEDGTGYRWFPIEYGDRAAATTAPDLSAKPTAPLR